MWVVKIPEEQSFDDDACDIDAFANDLEKERVLLNRLASFVYSKWGRYGASVDKYEKVKERLHIMMRVKHSAFASDYVKEHALEEYGKEREDMVKLLKKMKESNEGD